MFTSTFTQVLCFCGSLFNESPFNLWLLLFTIGNLALFKTACPKLEKNMITIVTDREQGIRAAIKKSLPSNPILLC